MKQNTVEIFKYEMYHAKLNFNLHALQNFCFELQNNNQGRVRSNVGGWQSNDLFDEYPIISDLRKIILDNINIYANKFNFKKELKLSNLWININEYKDSNMIHLHPNSIFSGVFYVKVPKNSGNFTFHNPCEDFAESVFRNNISEYNTMNSSTWFFEPQEDVLFLFPSFLKHSVTPNMNKEEKRISLSFNSIIV